MCVFHICGSVLGTMQILTKQNGIFFPISVNDSAIFLVAKLQTSIFFDLFIVTKSNESPIREVSLKDFNYFLLFYFHCHHANKYFHLDISQSAIKQSTRVHRVW